MRFTEALVKLFAGEIESAVRDGGVRIYVDGRDNLCFDATDDYKASIGDGELRLDRYEMGADWEPVPFPPARQPRKRCLLLWESLDKGTFMEGYCLEELVRIHKEDLKTVIDMSDGDKPVTVWEKGRGMLV